MTWITSLWRSVRRDPERRPGPGRNPTPRRRAFRPLLEALEDRIVPITLAVLNSLDRGAGSLRDAIGHARDGDTIVFDPSLAGQTITLTSGTLVMKKSL